MVILVVGESEGKSLSQQVSDRSLIMHADMIRAYILGVGVCEVEARGGGVGCGGTRREPISTGQCPLKDGVCW